MQCSREQQAQINLKFISVYLLGTVKCNFAKLGFPQQQTIKNLLFHDHCSANRVVISYNILRMLYCLDVETEQTAHQTNRSSCLQTQFINVILLLCKG